MQTYELIVEGRTIRPNSDDVTLVRTSVGMDRVHVLFDSSEWVSFPVTATFSQDGVNPVTTSMTVSSVSNSSKWQAQGTVVVPHEAITRVGPIRVTFQGTNSGGNHIITAFGEPLTVEEAGDVAPGDMPSDAPSMNQWQQAYADAMAVINAAQSMVDNLQDRVDEIVEGAGDDIQDQVNTIVSMYAVPATTESLGLVQVGDGLSVTDEGILSSTAVGMTDSQVAQLANLASLAYYCFDTTFDGDGNLEEGATVKASALSLSSLIDGETIVLDDGGKLAVALPIIDGTGY